MSSQFLPLSINQIYNVKISAAKLLDLFLYKNKNFPTPIGLDSSDRPLG